jgi:hypothetical protein
MKTLAVSLAAFGILGLCDGPVRAETASIRLAAVGGLEQPCAADGICNAAVCDDDPDCPRLPGKPAPASTPGDRVETPCGGELWVEATDSSLGTAATTVRRKYPNFNLAQKAKNPSFLDAHPSGALATGHAELKGFGVTMVQGKWPNPVENATGRLDDPTLLFFRKDGKEQDDWAIIGMGYSFALDRDGENAPNVMPAIPACKWFVHEAGYHRSPGDGGFTCATNDDLQKSAFNAGKRIDSAGCRAITKSDLKTREFHVDQKHGRFWGAHVWFEPGTFRPAVAETDPWCRQGSDALPVNGCAFFTRGSCS